MSIKMTTPKQTRLTQTQIVKVAIEAAETAVSAHGENFPDAESALDFLTHQVYADSEKTEDQMFAEKLDALLRMHSQSPEFLLFAARPAKMLSAPTE